MKTFTKSFMILLIACISLPLSAQDKLLGNIKFPNSGAPEAQKDFIQGVLFLHNFEYADAARSFKKAREKDPEFALAYYGEAKSHNHPIWMEQDRDAAMEVLNQLGATPAERKAKADTEREKDYLHSLEILYGNTPETNGLSKEKRDLAYMQYMAELHEKYPEDDEITSFYGLSILGSAHEGRDFRIYMRAAAVLFNVWNDNQKHPGAAHYLIHSFDDPTHAPLGLPMARAYSEIAPAAAHAQHMTSHIFLAMGMWDDVINANIVARNVQTTRQKELNESTTVCGHYPWWLQYGYMQTGEIEKAGQVLNTCYERIQEDPSSGELWHFAIMRGHQIVDSEDWSAIDEWTADIGSNSPGDRNYLFTKAYASLMSGKAEQARMALSNLMEIDSDDPELQIQRDQIKALMLIEEGNTKEGLSLLEKAVEVESKLPIAFGPPTIIKPSLELYGDVLLDMGRKAEAAEAYNGQLQRTPERRRSMMGHEKAVGS
ncbi:tetratricopeptide repeat protein [Balneola sp. MJW-20]|uniref:tetratricopeptide repeat protein n=1 Tax=Gracilimonas aurantiaca TaxID=3234185 RepID=UPI003466BB70